MYARRPEKFLDIEEVRGRLAEAGKMRWSERPLGRRATRLQGPPCRRLSYRCAPAVLSSPVTPNQAKTTVRRSVPP
jgi:hypothetical protein